MCGFEGNLRNLAPARRPTRRLPTGMSRSVTRVTLGYACPESLSHWGTCSANTTAASHPNMVTTQPHRCPNAGKSCPYKAGRHSSAVRVPLASAPVKAWHCISHFLLPAHLASAFLFNYLTPRTSAEIALRATDTSIT